MYVKKRKKTPTMLAGMVDLLKLPTERRALMCIHKGNLL